MAEEQSEQSEKTFTVSDKRFSARREPAPEPPPAEAQAPRATTASQDRAQAQAGTSPTPPSEGVEFASLLVMLGTQASMYLGDLPNPMNQKREKDLTAAKHFVDLLGILQAKTKGNLTGDEEHLLQQLLFDLRLRYVRETGR
jgi:hypothetical protein